MNDVTVVIYCVTCRVAKVPTFSGIHNNLKSLKIKNYKQQLSGMMETAKCDSSMMAGMYNVMKDNPQMMQNNTGDGMMHDKKHKRRMGN